MLNNNNNNNTSNTNHQTQYDKASQTNNGGSGSGHNNNIIEEEEAQRNRIINIVLMLCELGDTINEQYFMARNGINIDDNDDLIGGIRSLIRNVYRRANNFLNQFI